MDFLRRIFKPSVIGNSKEWVLQLTEKNRFVYLCSGTGLQPVDNPKDAYISDKVRFERIARFLRMDDMEFLSESLKQQESSIRGKIPTEEQIWTKFARTAAEGWRDEAQSHISKSLIRTARAVSLAQASNDYERKQMAREKEPSLQVAPSVTPVASRREDRIGDLAERITGAFERHLKTKLIPQLQTEPVMLEALRKVDAVFRTTARITAEKAELSANDQEMHSFDMRDTSEKVRLNVTTIPCKPGEASIYFSRIPPGGYSEFLNQTLYFPAGYTTARAEGIQIFANLVVVAYLETGKTKIVVHLCVLPHGDDNQSHCPVGITPTDLFTAEERKMYGL